MTRWFSHALFTLRALLRPGRMDAELDEELAFHMEREAHLYESQGSPPEEARRRAALQFGGALRYRDECRDVRGLAWLDDLRADLRYACRLATHHPGFSLTVITIAALGIAACASTFSLVSGILLSPLPFPAADRVVMLELRGSDGETTAAFPVSAYESLSRGSPALDAIAAFAPEEVTVDWGGEPESLRAELVTPSFLRVFGISPAIGRAFTQAEAENETALVMLGHATWLSRFNADPDVIGRAIRLDGKPHTIVGVMPPRFRAHFVEEPALWLPMSLRRDAGTVEGDATLNAAARIGPGISRETAEVLLAGTVRARIAAQVPGDTVQAMPQLVPISNYIYGYMSRPLYVLLGAVILVLLLVSANVATMFLARTTARDHEFGVRGALGASGGRQVRQLVTESVALTVVGGVLGVVASYWGVALVRSLGEGVLPRMDDVALDWRVALFSAVATTFTGVAGGLAPGLVRQFAGTTTPVATSGDRVIGQRTSSVLVIAQIAFSVVLLAGAGLLMKGFLRVLPTDPGFSIEHRATLAMSIRGQPGIDTGRFGGRNFVSDVTGRVRRIDGVRDVAATSFAPFVGMVSIGQVELAGAPPSERPHSAFQNLVTNNYFDVMDVPIERGRSFTTADTEGAERVAIVNEYAATRWWPGENAVGKQVTIDGRNRFIARIVGVAANGRIIGRDTRIRPELYLPLMQGDPGYVTFIVHTVGDPTTLAPMLRRAIWSVAPQLPISTTSDLATLARESVRGERFFSLTISTFAAAAIALTALGIYGLLSFSVARRRREIGIRIALGAPVASVANLVLRRAAFMGIAGVTSGTLLAWWLSRYMESVLVEVAAVDATVFAGTAMAVLAVSLLSAAAPVTQAVRTDPVRSLRSQ